MSDLRFREKLRQVEKAATTSDQVPEKAKRVGVLIVFAFALLLIVGLLTLAVLTAIGSSYGTAIFLTVIGIGLAFIVWNVYRAPKLP